MEHDAKNECSKISQKNLDEAIGHANILLSFASKRGIQLEEPTIKSIVKSRNKDITTEELEIDFWIQYSRLAKSVLPATAESIQAMAPLSPKGKSQAQNIVWRYTLITLIVLILLVTFQAYWTIGNFITTDIRVKREQSQQIEEKIIRNATTSDIKHDNIYSASEIKKLETEKRNLEFYISSNYVSLDVWDFFVQRNDINDPDKTIEDNISSIQRAFVYLEILQTYILPFIYGLLGTCVYILRDLSFKAKNCSFTQASTINFNIRLFLGALGGITSAWFIVSGKSSEGIMSLSPLALAFLTGYSIEILFSAMDTFIGAFTGKKFAATPTSEK